MSSAHIPHTPVQNHILASLPRADYARILPFLEPVMMRTGAVVFESGEQINYMHFPTTSIVSLLYDLEDGSSPHVAMIGNEGAIGIPLLLGGDSTPNRAVVQCAGEGYRLKASNLLPELDLHGELHSQLLLFTQARMTQTAQIAVCNRSHPLLQQLCRWLLCSLDRTVGAELVMTQELIALNLGVRREGVTEAAGKLQADGLIQYRRGRIQVLNRAGLEAQVCECYAVVREEYARLLDKVELPHRCAVCPPTPSENATAPSPMQM